MSGRILTVPEVAEALQVSSYTVREYLRRGVLAGVRVGGGGPWRVRERDLLLVSQSHVDVQGDRATPRTDRGDGAHLPGCACEVCVPSDWAMAWAAWAAAR